MADSDECAWHLDTVVRTISLPRQYAVETVDWDHGHASSRVFSHQLVRRLCVRQSLFLSRCMLVASYHLHGGSVMIASKSSPHLHGLLVTSNVHRSRIRFSTPYWLAARRIPGAFSLPRICRPSISEPYTNAPKWAVVCFRWQGWADRQKSILFEWRNRC